MIFCGVNPDHLHYLNALFLCFEAVSGLKINLAKLELVSVGIVNNVDGLAGIPGRKISSLPLKYCKLLLRASFKAKSIWKIKHHLASWKML